MRLTALALLLLALPAAAQETRRAPPGVLRPGIGESDPRRTVNLAAPPWRALARVQTELGTRCTGALIAPRLVITAAHCLLAPVSGQYVQPRSLHVLLGYDRGTFVAHARTNAFRIAPDYIPGRGQAGADWALITLDTPIGTPDRILPLLREPPPPRTPVMLGGWQQDRPEMLLADTGCRLLGTARQPGGLTSLVHDCAGTRGASGAPLLAQTPDGTWAIIGIQSAVATDLALGHAAPAGAVRE
jgi:protease YdgD